MNRLSKQIAVAVFGLGAFIYALGTAGSYEYAEQVCYTMREGVYEAVNDKLGGNATQKQIAAEYMNNRSYYDNIVK